MYYASVANKVPIGGKKHPTPKCNIEFPPKLSSEELDKIVAGVLNPFKSQHTFSAYSEAVNRYNQDFFTYLDSQVSKAILLELISFFAERGFSYSGWDEMLDNFYICPEKSCIPSQDLSADT